MTKEEFGEDLKDITNLMNWRIFTKEAEDYKCYTLNMLFLIKDTLCKNEKYFKFIKRIYAKTKFIYPNVAVTSFNIIFEVGLFNYLIEFNFLDDFFNKVKYDEVEFLSIIEECFQKLTNLVRV